MKTIVRFSAVLLTLIMIVCAMSLVSAATYTDVDNKTAHVDAIDTLSALGILAGYDDGSFKPDANVERDEMAKIIYITATTFTEIGEGVKIFPDVPAKQWANGYISWCHGKSIVGGYEDGTFRPDDNITFNEALKMACAMLGYNDFNPDMWPTDMIEVAVYQLKLNDGIDIDPFTAGDTIITRAQAAQIICNAFTTPMKPTTKTIVETGNFVIGGVVTTSREVEVLVSTTLAEDVWNCDVKNYQIVATESFAVELLSVGESTVTAGVRNLSPTRRIYKSAKTDSKTLIQVVDNNNVITTIDVVEDLGLTEYRGKTDDLLFFTYSLVYRNGEQIGVPTIKGSKTEKLPVATTKAPSYLPDTTDQGSNVYYYRDRLTLDGVLHDGEVFKNLRVATLGKTDGLYTIFDVEPDNVSNTDPRDTDYHLTTDRRADLFVYEPYVGYYATHTGWDINGDGFYDILSKAHQQPIEVIAISVNNGVKTLNYKTLYSTVKMYSEDTTGGLTYQIPLEDVISPRELKAGDIIIGYNLSNVKLQVLSIVDPVTAKATAVSGSQLKLENIGNVQAAANQFIGSSIPASALPLSNAVEDYLTVDPKTRELPEHTFWLFGSLVLKTDVPVSETPDEINKAILLYVDEKPEIQLDKENNRYVQLYPAYLLINGKEEAVNLNPNNAIDGGSGDYVSSDNSIYRAIVENDILEYVYIPVSYTVDIDGYYTLYTTVEDLKDDKGTADTSDDVIIEKVIPADEHPVLSFNEDTELYTLTTDSATYKRVLFDESSYIYYTYTKPSTGDYRYISFYTSDSVPTTEFTPVSFSSNVYMSYDEETGYYTLKFAVLTDDTKFEVDDGITSVDYNEDGRVIYMAVANSAYVAYNETTHYEHTFYNILTGETFSAVNEELSVVNGANNTVAGYFYAWSESEQDWVEVTARGALNSAATLNGYTIDSYNDALDIIYTVESDYAEGLKLKGDFAIYAIDDELNVIEVNFDDIATAWDAYDAESDTLRMVFVTYEDESGDDVIAYALVEWAEIIENDDGTIETELHDNVIGAIWE